MLGYIKKLAKKSQTIVNLHAKMVFLRWQLKNIPISDLRQIGKVRLMCKVIPYTKLNYTRLAKLYEIAKTLESEKLQGNLVECGVWRGGSAGIVAATVKNRESWLFDSFEGCPKPTDLDIAYDGQEGKEGAYKADEREVRRLFFDKLRIDESRVKIVRGLFEDTIPKFKDKIGLIALLHLDADWHESTKLCLENLYDKVVERGFVVIDDYGYWEGCRKAVDEFIKQNNLKVKLIKTDYPEVYFQKPSRFNNEET